MSGEVGAERCDHRERGALCVAGDDGATVAAQLVGDAVEDEQLTVEGVERSQAEVAVLEQLADRQLTVVDPVEQGAHDAGLEHGVTPSGLQQHTHSVHQSCREGASGAEIDSTEPGSEGWVRPSDSGVIADESGPTMALE